MHTNGPKTLSSFVFVTMLMIILVKLNPVIAQSKQAASSNKLENESINPNFPVDEYHYGENKIFYWFADQNAVRLIIKKNYQQKLNPTNSLIIYHGLLNGNSYFSTESKTFFYNSKVNTDQITEVDMLPRELRRQENSGSGSWNYNIDINNDMGVGIVAASPAGYKIFSLTAEGDLKIYNVLRCFWKSAAGFDSVFQASTALEPEMTGQFIRVDGDKLFVFDFKGKTSDVKHVSQGTLKILPYSKSQASYLMIDINKSETFTKTMLNKTFQAQSLSGTSSQLGVPSYVRANVIRKENRYILTLLDDESTHIVFRPIPKNGDTTKFNKFNASITLNQGGWGEITKSENGLDIVKFYAFTVGDNAVTNSITLAEFKRTFYDPK